MQLLGHLVLQRECRHGDRRQTREGKQVRCRERLDSFRGDRPESDVEQEGLELAASQRRHDAEAPASTKLVFRGPCPLNVEGEEVPFVVISGVQERVQELVLPTSPVEVDVFGGAGAIDQAKDKRDASFE